ncbi:Dynein regulatory complex subunit 4, partial [Larimichthys crocea]
VSFLPPFSIPAGRSRWTAVSQVEQERDDIRKKQDKAIIKMQRKSGLKDLLLEKKIAAQTEVLEKTQAHLYAVLAAQGDSSAAAKLEVQVKYEGAGMRVSTSKSEAMDLSSSWLYVYIAVHLQCLFAEPQTCTEC